MINENDLPDGWKVVEFKDIFEMKKGKKVNTTDNNSNGAIPYIVIGNLRGNPILQYTFDKNGVFCAKNDLLLVWDGANCGTVGHNLSGYVGSTITRLKLVSESVNEIYVYHFLKSKFKYFNLNTTGATIPHLNKKAVISLKIPLPPLQTQKKIVAILEKAERLKEWRKEADELTDEFLKNTFLEMFGDPISNEHHFDVGTIRDLTIKTQYGTSKKANEGGNGIPILRMGNITYSGNFDFSSLKHIEFDENEKRKYLVNKGELLFNRTNSKELVGKSAVYRMNEPMAFAGYLIKLITDSPATSEFIAGHLNSKYGKLYLQKMAKNIVGMANINAQEVQNIPILIPPIESRQKFASIVQQVEQLREHQSQSRQHIDDLFNVLMQKAFKGELV